MPSLHLDAGETGRFVSILVETEPAAESMKTGNRGPIGPSKHERWSR
jgi:hypothetical protein